MMREPTHGLDRRSFLRRGLGAALAFPAAGALAALAGCGDSSNSSAPPTATPYGAAPPAASPPAAPAPAAPAPAAAADALVDQIPANAGLLASLQYANLSPIAGQVCAGCQLYTPVSEDKGKCVLFLQGLVAAKGHCSSWVKKQA